MGTVIAAPGTNSHVNTLPQPMTAVLPTGFAPSAAHSPSSALGQTAPDDAADHPAGGVFKSSRHADADHELLSELDDEPFGRLLSTWIDAA